MVDVVPHEALELVWSVRQHSPNLGLDFCLAGTATTRMHGPDTLYKVQAGHLSCGYFSGTALHGTPRVDGPMWLP